TGNKYSIFDPNLSNTFNNKYTTHNGNINFRKGNRDKMFSIGLALQHAQLNSEQVYPYTATVNRSFTNLLPEAMFSRKLSKRSTIRVNYRTNTNAPSVTQLQNVINNSNALFLSTGNPELKQQFGQILSARYTFTNTGKGQSLFVNMFLQQNDNYISNATFIATRDSVLNPSVTLFRGAQLSKPVNLNGYRSLRGFVTFGQPINAIKTNVNINAGINLVSTPGIVNNIANTSKTTAFNTGIVFASNVSQYVDFTLSYNASFNNTINSLQPQLNNKYFNYNGGVQVNLLNKKGWFFQNDVSNQVYRGLSDGFNQNYWLWNMGLGKKFLKDQKGELKFSVFDLLKQNQSITRTSTESGIQDVQNTVLRQYFMLTFTYKLKNFGTPPANNNNREREGFDPRRMGGGGFFN
ncbi:MAG: outer membrane beta-barrel protein, partial [Dinghuibacter sp.]|nr:outer membrane beta-barrel protein [Dinghuibacter sp.]